MSSDFIRKAGTIMAGTVMAQLLLVVTVPLLSRLYEVNLFGELGMFMLLGMFGTQLFCWRIDYGIAGAGNDVQARQMLALCLIAAIFSIFLFGSILHYVLTFLPLQKEFNFDAYFPALIAYWFFAAVWNAVTFYNIRQQQYRLNAFGSLVRAAAIVGFSLLFYKMPFNGLILALAIGQAAITLYLLGATVYKMDGPFFSRGVFGLPALWRTLTNARGFIAYSLPSAGIELLSGQLPQYIIGSFGPRVFGWFSQANRLINTPLDLIGQSIRSVFWETAGKDFREKGNCLALFDKIAVRLAAYSVVPFALLFWLAPLLFSWVLGPQWAEAGYYARLLVPMCFFRFVSNPLSSLFYIAHKQRIDFAIQAIVLFIVTIIFIYPGIAILQPKIAIGVYATIYSVKYMAEWWFSRRFAAGLQ